MILLLKQAETAIALQGQLSGRSGMLKWPRCPLAPYRTESDPRSSSKPWCNADKSTWPPTEFRKPPPMRKTRNSSAATNHRSPRCKPQSPPPSDSIRLGRRKRASVLRRRTESADRCRPRSELGEDAPCRRIALRVRPWCEAQAGNRCEENNSRRIAPSCRRCGTDRRPDLPTVNLLTYCCAAQMPPTRTSKNSPSPRRRHDSRAACHGV